MLKPKFLVDANMPRSSAEVFSTRGHEVEDVRDIGLGSASDDAIIEYAKNHNAIVVTRDTDFGSVLRHPNHPGAILMRLSPTTTAEDINNRLAKFMDETGADRFVHSIHVVEPHRTRRRRISR